MVMATAGTVKLEDALGPQPTAQQARPVFAQGEESVIFAPLDLAEELRRAASVSSSMVWLA